MELLIFTFLGLMGFAALIAFVVSVALAAVFSSTKIGVFAFGKFAERKPYVYRVIDVISMLTTLSITTVLAFGFDVEPVVACGIAFLCSTPAIIYWHFVRPEFLNKPVNL